MFLDLVSPDGKIVEKNGAEATLLFEQVPPQFRGFAIDPSLIQFTIKSLLAQLGLDAVLCGIDFFPHLRKIETHIRFEPKDPIAINLLSLIETGAFCGRLFAADPDRIVRKMDYLTRMFDRSDLNGSPLLSFRGEVEFRTIGGKVCAYVPLLPGTLSYKESIHSFLKTVALGLQRADLSLRKFLPLHQQALPETPRILPKDQILLVKTHPMQIKTMFARVASSELPKGIFHTSASLLDAGVKEPGEIFEFYGDATQELTYIPLEFFTLEPYKEYIFFSDRARLQGMLANEQNIFSAFQTILAPKNHKSSIWIVNAEQLHTLKNEDWISKNYYIPNLPICERSSSDAILIQNYLQNQPETYYLKKIESEEFTSQGVLFSRFFPSPHTKRLFLSEKVKRQIQRLYFQYASRSSDYFFTHEDRTFMIDLTRLGIKIFWANPLSKRVLEFVERPGRYCGMFIPQEKVSTFLEATFFGVYGSNLIEGCFKDELKALMAGLIELQKRMSHPLLNPKTPLAIITGGGPGVMEVGNYVAKDLGILSLANIVDFSNQRSMNVTEQLINPYIEGKMTYRIDQLIERQSEFYLDFPIFLEGGIGTDFELALEEVRRKIHAVPPNPIILFGDPNYWKEKISHRFQMNLKLGTIRGSEWISRCCYVVQNHVQALKIYDDFFSYRLNTEPGPDFDEKGFVLVQEE